tara:strand:- start:331 stop:555 length:225 start_codon:yes stop_codon:yes gene_type:complete
MLDIASINFVRCYALLIMNMIGIFLKDQKLKELNNKLADLQIREMVEQKWLPEEIQLVKGEISARYKELKRVDK